MVAGFLASRIENKTDSDPLMDIVLGVAGAFVGGFIFNLFGQSNLTGFDLYSVFVSFIGAAAALLIYRAFFRRRAI
jgi:uncharacterized membrane protein YeaQ/YmgE (transglycosylase-associated protein family)